MRTRQFAALALAGVLALGFGIAPAAEAAGGNPHFLASKTSDSVDSAGNLAVSFKEAGLASGSVETIHVDATAIANWFCVNGGAHNPAATNKRTASSQVTASGTFTADQNGNVTGTLTAPQGGLQAPSDFSCPGGQSLKLGSVSYTSVSITDDTSGASLALPDVSSGCLITVKFSKGVTCVG